MRSPTWIRRLQRLRLRSVLFLVALLGLCIGVWESDVYRAWVYYLIGCERDAWLAAIEAPRSGARDRVLVAALAKIVDDSGAPLGERRAAIMTLSCLVPEVANALSTLERACANPDLVEYCVSGPLAELARVDSDATRLLLALLPGWQDLSGSDPLGDALKNSGESSHPLIATAFLAAFDSPSCTEQTLVSLINGLHASGTRAPELARALGHLARDRSRSRNVRVYAASKLISMKEGATPALSDLVDILTDPVVEQDAIFQNVITWAFKAIGATTHGAAPDFVAALETRKSSWSEWDVRLFSALAPMGTEKRRVLQSVITTESMDYQVRASAAVCLLAIDPSSPEPIEFVAEFFSADDAARQVALKSGRSLWELSNNPTLASQPAAVERLSRLLLSANAAWREDVLVLLRLGGPEVATVLPTLIASIPLVEPEYRPMLLMLAATLAAPNERLRDLLHTELRSSSPASVKLAMTWITQVGPDSQAIEYLQRHAGECPLYVIRGVCASSRSAVRSLAIELLESNEKKSARVGAELLARSEPEHPALLRWVSRVLADDPSDATRVIVGFAYYRLGHHARSLNPWLFRELMASDGSAVIARTIRHIEGRAGWDGEPGNLY